MKKLYIYDVRGIQKYIFRTNKIKEIIGASALVESLVLTLFKECTKKAANKNIVTDISENDKLKFQFDDKNTIDAEIVYYGGGNLLVLYNDEEFAEQISKEMCMALVQKTYSLQMAYASVDVQNENSYETDYKKLRQQLEKVKDNMPMCRPVKGFPITLNDPLTGMAFSKEYKGKMCTYEACKKLEKYDALNINPQKIDEFGTEEGNSRIAIVHIDGNSMGKRIKKTMEGVRDYKTAAEKYRKLSGNIQDIFVNTALKNVENNVEKMCEKAGLQNRTKDTVYRRIISAGDDITFICNSKIAMSCVTTFMDALNKEELGYTACAGIYITHSKFPFSKAYELSEELCDSAKVPSRKEAGNYVDFQFRMGASLNSLEMIREKQFISFEGKTLIGRPYHIGAPLKDENVKELDDLMTMLNDLKKRNVPRTKLKNLRDMFFEGEALVDYELNKINSRLTDEDKVINPDHQILFDAIDILDLGWEEQNDL